MTVLPTQLFLAASLGLASFIVLAFGVSVLWAALSRRRAIIRPTGRHGRSADLLDTAREPPSRRQRTTTCRGA